MRLMLGWWRVGIRVLLWRMNERTKVFCLCPGIESDYHSYKCQLTNANSDTNENFLSIMTLVEIQRS